MTLTRCALWLGLACLLVAPTPGATGSCSGDDLDEPADVVDYCKRRDELICVRRWLRGELSVVDRDECRRQALDVCERRYWAPGCRPSQRQADACLNALSAKATVDTPEDELDECGAAALCSAPIDRDTDAGALAP